MTIYQYGHADFLPKVHSHYDFCTVIILLSFHLNSSATWCFSGEGQAVAPPAENGEGVVAAENEDPGEMVVPEDEEKPKDVVSLTMPV